MKTCSSASFGQNKFKGNKVKEKFNILTSKMYHNSYKPTTCLMKVTETKSQRVT